MPMVEAGKKTQKPKIWSSKEASVSPGMFTFRDGSLTVLPAAIAYTIHKRRMDLSMGGCHPLGKWCTGVWLSPPGPREGNSRWLSSRGLALAGGSSGIEGRLGRFLAPL